VLHIWAAWSLTVRNAQARPHGYKQLESQASTYASRTMRWSGVIILVFVIYHLMHFTFGNAHPVFVEGDVYHNVVAGFRVWPVALFYVFAMVLLGFHLNHGVWSMFPHAGRLASGRRRACARWRPRFRVWSCSGTSRSRWPSCRTGVMKLDSRIPEGAIEDKWEHRRFSVRLVNPANKRKYKVLMVGTGLAGASAAASLAELGYDVAAFCYQDSPRRAHSIAAQGGINAAKNYRNDGDSVHRLFYDTVKGGDFRAREANVHRLAEVSVSIIDQCVAQGVPFAREYGGLLDNRSFGGAQVSRTFYARGQTGQQLLLGAYQALERQVGLGKVRMHARHEMLDLIVSTAARAASWCATW
jgi:succinate dehydrogenase/fumarate reductase cytochrome b subunit